MKNSLIRGTIGMLNDKTRMERKDEALNYLSNVTNSILQEEIIQSLKIKTYEELIKINIKLTTYLKQTPISQISHLTCELYNSYGKYKGD